MRHRVRKKRLGVFKFASCSGCQLSLLDCEDELLAISAAVEIGYFPEASTRALRGRFDVALVEGSISAPAQLAQIHDVRRRTRTLVTIGACATAGGIQALRNFADVDEFCAAVYAQPSYIHTLAVSNPISYFVRVDFELRGCPINNQQLLAVLSALLAGSTPALPNHSVCIECKRSGAVCVTVAHGVTCLGPITHAGCGAICPSYDRGCYGCYGPAKNPNLAALVAQLRRQQMDEASIRRLLHTFNAWAPELREYT